MKLNSLFALVAMTATVAACGGGGGGSAPQIPQTTSSPVDSSRLGFSGTVSAPLDTTNTVTLYAAGAGTGSTDAEVMQDTKGALIKFDRFSLSGDYGVQEIAGNSSFAIGRWSAGDQSEVDPNTKAITTTNLLKYTNGSSYYITLHKPQAALANFNNGTLTTCAETYITKPKNTDGRGDSFARSFSVQNGTIKFDTIGSAAVEFTINAADSKGSASTTFVTDIRWVAFESGSAYNGFNTLGLKGQTGQSNLNGFVQLGTATAGSVLVGGIYTVKLTNQAAYTGSFAMICK
jgi:hypothetical protein